MIKTMNLKKIVEISYALMDKSDFKKRCRHFSFICSGKRILSIGINNSKTHPINLNFDYVNRQKKYIRDVVGTHSEINAVLKIGKEKFTREILFYCYSKAELSYVEAREQFARKVLESNDYYNGHIRVRVHGKGILKKP